MTYTSKSETTINASADKVWEALTDPAIVKQWLFGTNMVVSEWVVGGKIAYKGEWEGKPYEDKGVIQEIELGKKLVTTYWSNFSGVPDSPENYQVVSYELFPEGDGTKLVITQQGAKTEEAAKHSEGNWNGVLSSMKQLLEKIN
jgi:uncharacterized protein YndB with AHSA1/START domain